jgi:hypothetical protein
MRRLFVLAIVMALLPGALPAAGEGQAPQADTFLHLPVIIRQAAPLLGSVTMQGAPAAGVLLELKHYNGASWNGLATTTTDASGAYSFSPPTLNPGESYRVEYLNYTDDSRLFFWRTATLTTYSDTVGAALATFDVANVLQVLPEPDASLPLPIDFSWQVRAYSPTDSYELNLEGEGNLGSIVAYPGYVGEYTLTGPLYSDPGWYKWWVAVWAKAGAFAPWEAYGVPFYYQWVYIETATANANRPTRAAQGPLAARLPGLSNPVVDGPRREPVMARP